MAKNEIDKRKMKWQVDLDNFFDVFSTFIIDGNIDDIQPIIDSEGNCSYDHVKGYFQERFFHQGEKNKKCVIIYDPTESDDKRFDITSRVNGEIGVYSDKVAQHFWDILHEDKVDKQLIEHNAAGPTYDIARIHYAATESGRLLEGEHIPGLGDFWSDVVNNRVESVETTGYVFVLKMTSRLLRREGSANGVESDELMLFRQILNISQNIDADRHKLIILANKATDLPMWFIDEGANPFIKKITIEKPSATNKKIFFEKLIENKKFGDEFNKKYNSAIKESEKQHDTGDGESEFEKKIKRKFLAYTNDFSMKMLKYYEKYLEKNKIDSPDKIGFSVSSFKAGTLINPWEDEDTVLDILSISAKVSEKIKGQDQAIAAVQGILTRAVVGLGRADNPHAPRAVLFLAGPTGTGKTEICKQLAETMFGSEDRIVRFDMSEYGQEHSDQKLFGAPPGYIGYENGGELTNAMKKEPFSLVLFDEIEKAHGSIMDKFLQILSDGRLTDGMGETVSFTDAIIVFTSNAGVTSPTPKSREEEEDIKKKMGNEAPPEMEMNMAAVIELESDNVDKEEIYKRVKEYFRYNVKHYFCCTLGRPELYGRIEDALVYYNYIREDCVKDICKNKMTSINNEAKDTHKLSSVDFSKVLDRIVEHCKSERVRSMGARGIGKAINVIYEGSLSREISEYIVKKQRDQLNGKKAVCIITGDTTGVLTADNIKWSFE